MAETSLAALIPLWRSVREDGVTAMVTPAADYVGAIELAPLDLRFDTEESLIQRGEAIRSLVSSLDDEASLLLVYQVDDDISSSIAAYAAQAADAPHPTLKAYVTERAAWLRTQPARRCRIFCFFALGGAAASVLTRGNLGLPLIFKAPESIGRDAHKAALKALGAFRDRIRSRFAGVGMGSRELELEEVHALFFDLLNPSRARKGHYPPEVTVRDNLWSAASLRTDAALREYTEAEQLVFEDIDDARGYFRQEDVFRRAMTLKTLPEGRTLYFHTQELANLYARDAHGRAAPFPYRLAVGINIRPQARTKFLLDKQHGLVDALGKVFPFLQSSSVQDSVEAGAKQASIHGLFHELSEMSSKLVTVSVTVLLEGDSLEQLDLRTEAVRAAFSNMGNSQLLMEEISQVPAFLATLPSSAPYQLRRKGCTSRNAGDLLPVFGPWRGTRRVTSLLHSTNWDALRFDPFDSDLATAHHGLVVADTGSGKSVSLGALTLDALAAGHDAVLVDNGGSWKGLTEICDGTHIPVDLRTSISPFGDYASMLGLEEAVLDPDAIESVVNFLEVCVTDRSFPGFDNMARAVVGRAVRNVYRSYRERSDRPLIGDFRDALRALNDGDAQDASIAGDVARRLGDFCEGTYAEFLNRPSQLDFSSRLLTFDLAGVSKNATTRAVAMAAIMEAIGTRAARQRAAGRRTLVEIDEGHEHLGKGDSVETFLEGCYRKMRKFGVAMWMISQQFHDFETAKSGRAIIGNSKLKLFLRHDSGHDAVINAFALSPRAADAFRALELRKGHYSDLLMLYGKAVTTARLALSPLALWILTTDPADKELIAKAQASNPGLSRIELLQQLAIRYPHGRTSGARHRAA